MKRKASLFIFALTPLLCSLILGVSANSAAVFTVINEYLPVGGKIVPVSKYELLGPWVALITAISAIVAIVYWRRRPR